MSWVSLVCLLALSSAVLVQSVPLFSSGDGYGSSRIITPPPMDNYGSSRIITPPPMDNYGSSRIITPPPTDSYGSSRIITPPMDNYGSSRLISPPRLVSSGYGSEMPTTRISSGYGSSVFVPPPTRTLPVQGYGGGYGSSSRLLGGNELITEPLPPTQADILCRGQSPQTVIPIENNRKFVVCLEDGKGTEQSCPKGLFYHEQSRRCERKLGPMEDFCVSQPCLNGGLCVSTDSSFQCQCAPGFDGIVCELDAHYCQNNRPCGVDPSVRCQSFRADAALDWICVSDEDSTYGPDGQHIHRSQCDGLNGPHALAYTNKGFIMCDGERSHYESCPGGTIWDAFNKACVWPDMEESITDTRFIKSGYGSSYSSLPAPTRIVSSYDKVILPLPTRKIVSSYGGYGSAPETRRVSSYGGELTPPMPITKTFSSYGGELTPPTKVFSSYGGELTPPTKVFSSYGGELTPPTRSFSSYGGELTPPPTKVFSSYGGELTPPPTRSFSSYGSELPVPETKTFSSYGGSRMVLPPPIVKTAPSYGGY